MGLFLVQRLFVDVALNIQVPVAGFYLEKYLEANYGWNQDRGIIMGPTALAAVYLLSGDLVQALMDLNAVSYTSFESKDLNMLLYFWMVSFDFEDLLSAIFTLVVSSYVLFDWYNGDTKDTEYWVNVAMFVSSIIANGWNAIEFVTLIMQYGECF